MVRQDAETAARRRSPRPPPRAVLEVLDPEGDCAGVAFMVFDQGTPIGRGADCSVPVDSPAASRHHARIELRGDHHVVVDLGSTNGTSVNGQMVSGECPLRDGALVSLGGLTFRYREDDGGWVRSGGGPRDGAKLVRDIAITAPRPARRRGSARTRSGR